MNTNQNQKRYSFLNMKRAIGRNGSNFIGVTLEALVCKPQGLRQVNDSLVLNFSVPIYNRGKYIETLCGMAPYEDQAGTVWANVSFWQNASEQNGTATRLDKLLQNNQGKSLVLTITGAIRVEQTKDDQGNVYVNTNIIGDDFTLVRTFEKHNQQGGNSYQTQQAPQQGGYPNQGQPVPQQGGYPNQGQQVPQRGSYPNQGQPVPQQGSYPNQDQQQAPRQGGNYYQGRQTRQQGGNPYQGQQSQPSGIPNGLNGQFYDVDGDEDFPF